MKILNPLTIKKNLQVIKAKSTKIENLYNVLVQIDYLAGLCVAAMLGAGNWFLFVILLVVSLILGCITVRIYVKMMTAIAKDGKIGDANGVASGYNYRSCGAGIAQSAEVSSSNLD